MKDIKYKLGAEVSKMAKRERSKSKDKAKE